MIYSIDLKYLNNYGLYKAWQGAMRVKYLCEKSTSLTALKKTKTKFKKIIHIREIYKTGYPFHFICNYLQMICDEARERGLPYRRQKIPYGKTFLLTAKTSQTKMKIEVLYLHNQYKYLNPQLACDMFELLQQSELKCNEMFRLVEK